MDDLDLDKINLDDFNLPSDNTGSSNSSDNSAPRPKLRKIKRPKQHVGPISNMPQNASFSQINETKAASAQGLAQNTTSGQNVSSSQSSYNAAAPQGGLIRATDRNTYMPYENSFNASPEYSHPYVEDTADEEFVYQGNGGFLETLDTKKLMWIALGCILFGLLLGKFMFSSEQVVRNGLQGVVVNPEVPKGRTRCGVAEKTQGCVLYVMNPQRQELNGRDFYDLAAQLTGRQRFVIETGNMRYSSVKIKPGNIAQLNIPPLQ